MSVLTLLSRILGFVREVMSAALFGDRSGIYDAFVTAWRVPNLFRRFLGEGALSTSLQTALTEVDGDHGAEAGRRLFVRTLALVAALVAGVCAVTMGLVLLVPDTLPGTDWHWLGADPLAVRELCVRLFPFLFLVALAALAGGALQVRGRFAAVAIAPAAMNVVWIGALALIGGRHGWVETGAPAPPDAVQLEMARTLAWGVLLAGVVQLLVHVPPLLRAGLLVRANGSARASAAESERETHGAWTVLRTSTPLALGAAVYQINVMVDGLMAESLLPDGGPSAHYYANRIQQFPLALIAFAATSSVFPALKALGHTKRLGELRGLHDRTQLAICFLALPASAGLFVLAHPICRALFQHGAYGPEGVSRMAATLAMLGLALVPAGAVGLASRSYYALADFRTPVRISIAMLAANAALNVAFVVGAGMDADGLALATALTGWGNLVLLLPGLYRRIGVERTERGASPGSRLVRMALASAGAAGLARGAYDGTLWIAGEARSGLALATAAAVGVGGYAALALALRIPEARAVGARLRGLFGSQREPYDPGGR